LSTGWHRPALRALPSEKIQQSVRQEQLEYHRHQQQADEQRVEAAPKFKRDGRLWPPVCFSPNAKEDG